MQCKGEKTADVRKKCEIIKHFFASVVTQSRELTKDTEADAALFNALRNSQKYVRSVVISLDVTKATGPDKINNITLKVFHACQSF